MGSPKAELEKIEAELDRLEPKEKVTQRATRILQGVCIAGLIGLVVRYLIGEEKSDVMVYGLIAWCVIVIISFIVWLIYQTLGARRIELGKDHDLKRILIKQQNAKGQAAEGGLKIRS